jgi:hypothetical protein
VGERRRLPLALLALALVAGLGLRIVVIADKPAVSHDEAISYLAATCHQGEWDRVTTHAAPPVATWASADDWRRFVEPDRFMCFGQIGRDLSQHDIHPPLYFWLLHLWVGAVGATTTSGPALNLPIFVAAALALFWFARRMLADGVEAALVVLVWAVSPAVIPISAEARMYDLFALVSVLFVWQVVRVADRRRQSPGSLALLSAAAACGLATSFAFLLVAASAAVYLAVRLARRWPRPWAASLGAIALGFAIFFLVDPGFPSSFETQQEQRRVEFSVSGLPPRLDRTASGFAGFVFPERLLSPAASYALLGALCAAALAVGLLIRRRRSPSVEGAARDNASRGLEALYFGAAIGAGTAFLYLAFLTHGLAMGGKYLAACWPFLAFGLVLALRVAPARRTALAAVLCSAMLASGITGALLTYRGDHRPPDPTPYLSRSNAVLTDTVRRGVLLPIVLQLRRHEPVFAAPQRLLLAAPRRWLPALRGDSLYVSDTYYGDVPRQKAILETIRRGHKVDRVQPSLRGAGTGVFLVRPAAGQGAG